MRDQSVLEEICFSIRLYSLHELSAALAAQGLVVREVFCNERKEPFTISAKKMIIVAQKA